MSSDPKNEGAADNLDVIRELLRKLEEVAAADAKAANSDRADRPARATDESAVAPLDADRASIIINADSADAFSGSEQKAEQAEAAEGETILPIVPETSSRSSLREQLAAAGHLKPANERGLTTLQRGSALARLDVPSFPDIKLQSHDLATRPEGFHQLEVAAREERRGPARAVALFSFVLGAATAVGLIAFMDPIKHAVRTAMDHARVMVVDAKARNGSAQLETRANGNNRMDRTAVASVTGPQNTAAEQGVTSSRVASAVSTAPAVDSMAATASPAAPVSGSGDGAIRATMPAREESAESNKPAAASEQDGKQSNKVAEVDASNSAAPVENGLTNGAEQENASSKDEAQSLPAKDTDSVSVEPPKAEQQQDTPKAESKGKEVQPAAARTSAGSLAENSEPKGPAEPAKTKDLTSSPPVRVPPKAAAKEKPVAASPVVQAGPNTRPPAVRQNAATESPSAEPGAPPGSQPIAAEAVKLPSPRAKRGNERVVAKAAQRLSIPARVVVSTGRSVPLGLKLVPMPNENDQLLVVLRGVPERLRLSKGSALGNEIWLLPAHEAHDIMVDSAGPLDPSAAVEVQLVSLGGKIVASSRIKFESGQAAPSALPPSRIAASSAATVATRRLLAQADLLINIGDVVGARSLLRSAADAGSAEAALRLAHTFDPAELERQGILPEAADSVASRTWYQRARDLGSADAAKRLDAASNR